MPVQHETQTPSPWVVRWARLIRPGGEVLDLACGYGRHARFLAACGHAVLAADRDPAALATLAAAGGVRTLLADFEGEPWPFAPERFDAVVISHYLHRPLFPHLAAALRRGGLLNNAARDRAQEYERQD